MIPRDRRALLLGTIIAATALMALRGGPWIWHRSHEAIDRLRAREELLVRRRADVHDAKGLEDSVIAVRQRFLALAPKLLPGSTASEAVADLAGHLTLLAERHRVRLDRTDAVPDSTRGGELRRVTLHGVLEGDTRGTLDFLSGLARVPVAITLDHVRIVASDPGATSTVPEVLQTELKVHGWFLGQEKGQ